MECIDLRTGYMLLAFRSQKEVERAKSLSESRGIRVASALAYEDITESEAAGFVKKVQQEDRELFCNYTTQSADAQCETAKASLRTALDYLNAINGVECEYLLLYQKEEPLLQLRVQEQAQPEAPLA